MGSRTKWERGEENMLENTEIEDSCLIQTGSETTLLRID